MKVYLLYCEWCDGYDDKEWVIGTYDTREQAENELIAMLEGPDEHDCDTQYVVREHTMNQRC